MVHSKGFVSDSLRISKCVQSVGRLLPFDPATGRFNAQLEIDFFMTPVGISALESSTGSKIVLLEVSFKFPAAVISVNSHGTQPFIILFRGSGLERLALANVRWLDILDALSWHSNSVDFFFTAMRNTIFNEALEVELG